MKPILSSQLPKYPYPAVIVGNGPSRLKYDIELLKGRAVVFGCNRFFKDFDFSGYPHFIGMCDDEIIREALHFKRRFPLVTPAHGRDKRYSQSPFLYYEEVPHILYLTRSLWKVTGVALIQLAQELTCSPIFLMGFGEHGNVYHTESSLEKASRLGGYVHELWTTKQFALFRIGHHSESLVDIPYVEWDDLLNHLPLSLPVKDFVPSET